MKKRTKLSLAVTAVFVTVAIITGTVWGANALRKVDAIVNDSIKIYYDGDLITLTDMDGSKISPVIIDGRTYLPLRAISEVVDIGIEWDGNTKSIYMTSDGNNDTPISQVTPTPVNNTPTSQVTPTPVKNTSQPSNTTNKNAGTLEDPIKFGDTYYWSAREKYIDTYASADYSFSVLDVEPITIDYINSLGFRVDSDTSQIEYVMATVKVTVSNGKIESGEAYMELPFYRSIWGSKTNNGVSIIGGTDFGFDGSLNRASQDAVTDSEGFIKEITAEDICNFSYTGKVILPITKNAENYLVITKDISLDYDSRFTYFRLK